MNFLVPLDRLIGVVGNPAAKPTAYIDPAAVAKRDELVAVAESIERVAGESSQQLTVNTLSEIQSALNKVETNRKSAKAPFAGVGKMIDACATEYIAPLEAQKQRLKRLLGDYQAAIEAKAREERIRQEAELAKLRAEREAAEKRGDAEQVMRSDIQAVAVLASSDTEVKKAEGMAVAHKWVCRVVDVKALHAKFPEFVNLEPRMREINAAISQMAKENPEAPPSLPGCEVTKEIDVRTR